MVEKNLPFKSSCCSNINMFFLEKLIAIQNQLNISIEESKRKYYTKLSSRLIKTFLNSKKRPWIPPLFHGNKFITEFKEKSELFNHFFVNQCPLLCNNNVLYKDLHQLTSKCLDSITFLTSDIVKITSDLKRK